MLYEVITPHLDRDVRDSPRLGRLSPRRCRARVAHGRACGDAARRDAGASLEHRRGRHGLPSDQRLRRLHPGSGARVITSYSIHYTKLYECLQQAVFPEPSTSAYCLPFATGSSYSVSQAYCSPPPGSHQTRFAWDFDMPVGTEISSARKSAPRASWMVAGKARITSYNVCYTKLLRRFLC